MIVFVVKPEQRLRVESLILDAVRRGNRTLPSWSRHTGIPNQDVVRWKPVGTGESNWITSQTPQRLDSPRCCLKHMRIH